MWGINEVEGVQSGGLLAPGRPGMYRSAAVVIIKRSVAPFGWLNVMRHDAMRFALRCTVM